MGHKFEIAASILSADFARLGEEVDAVLQAGADRVHIDSMDNHYVPNLTVGPLACKALRRYGIQAPIDVHLMVKPVDQSIVEFAKAGATAISFHPEASEHIDRSLQLIRDQGCQVGLVFNPATPLGCLEYVAYNIDYILLMSVNPGFGGQKFLHSMFDKIKQTRALIDRLGLKDCRLEVDGGVNPDNIARIAQLGADRAVLGSALFGAEDYSKTLKMIRQVLG